MNRALFEGAMAMAARMIPSEEYAKIADGVRQMVSLLSRLENRLQAIEASCQRIEELSARLDLAEQVIRDNVPGAGMAYAERSMWMVPGSIETALAPAREGAINDY